MYDYEYTLETTASPEAIYQLYQDVRAWPAWDEGIENIEFDGPFVVGSKGKLKVGGQPPLDFSLTDVQPNRGFADETTLPHMGITVIFNHILDPIDNGGTRIRHQVKIIGPAAEALGPKIGPAITSDLPDAVAKLAQIAQAAQRS